jgi:hypothetical protein
MPTPTGVSKTSELGLQAAYENASLPKGGKFPKGKSYLNLFEYVQFAMVHVFPLQCSTIPK